MAIAHSLLTLYASDISKDKNMIVESLESYLSGISTQISIDNFQFIKPSLELTIKLDISQMDISPYSSLGHNYLKVVNVDEEGASKPAIYFFIEDIKWTAQHTAMLSLRMDVLNSFCGSWTESNVLDKQTRIKRATLKKYTKNTAYQRLKYNIPVLCDEINPIKYKKEDFVMEDSILPNKAKWYLIYRARLTTEELENRPVDCFITTDYEGLKIRTTINGSYNYSTLPDNYVWILGNENNSSASVSFIDENGENQTISIGVLGTRGAILIEKLTSPNKIRISLYSWSGYTTYYTHPITYPSGKTEGDTTSPQDTIVIENVAQGRYSSTLNQSLTSIQTWSTWAPTGGSVDLDLSPISSLDRTDTRIIKVIELPYCPIELTGVGTLTYTSTDGNIDISSQMIRLDDTTSSFKRSFDCFPSSSHNINSRTSSYKTITQFRTTYPNKTLMTDSLWLTDELEPMLFHSNYFSCKFVYDTYDKEIALEEIDGDMSYAYEIKFNFEFAMTGTINSRFMFDVVGNNGFTFKFNKDYYPNYLFIQRNNELPLYSSSFINYIRTGYNYDQKNRFYRNIEAGANLTFGAVETFANNYEKKGLMGSAVSTSMGLIKGGYSLYMQNVVELLSLEQKGISSQYQSETYSGADDLDLMNVYAENKLHFMTFAPNDIMKKALHQMYYFTGYPQNYFDNTLPHTNRYWFDFVQADIVFKVAYARSLSKEIQIDIIQKYNEGVIYFHRRNNEYDFEQKYVNHDSDLI